MKGITNWSKINLLKAVNVIALMLAFLSVETTCVWVHHQPKVPEVLKKYHECNDK